jgi:dTDP-4-dehydrorhamnose 3,5-epimerase
MTTFSGIEVNFLETPLPGAFIVEIEPHRDERGFFARTWCAHEFESKQLPTQFVQASISHNRRRGTLRGMHLQLPPSREGKLVRCMRGRIHDVIVDLRPDSRSYLAHFAVELASSDHTGLFIPPAVLHGFQTLEDDTEVFYQMTDYYAPAAAFGARWDDPAFGIDWPIVDEVIMAERDAAYPDFNRSSYELLAANGASA